MENVIIKLIKLSDIYSTSFLKAKGKPPIDYEVVRGKTLFVYPASDEIYKLLNDYNCGADCSALDFVTALKELRAKMYACRSEVR